MRNNLGWSKARGGKIVMAFNEIAEITCTRKIDKEKIRETEDVTLSDGNRNVNELAVGVSTGSGISQHL